MGEYAEPSLFGEAIYNDGNEDELGIILGRVINEAFTCFGSSTENLF